MNLEAVRQRIFGIGRSVTVPLAYASFFVLLLCTLIFLGNFSDAAEAQINPDGAGNTTQGTRFTCGTANNFDCINEGISSTSVPTTTTDYISFTRNQFDSYQLGTLSNVATATQVQIYIYHREGNANMQFQISLWNAAETTQIGTTQNVTIRTTDQWDVVTFSGLTLNQTALDGLRVRTTCTRPGGSSSNCFSYALYAYVTYSQVQQVTVSATSTQQNLDIGTTSAYLGGGFVIRENVSSRNVTSITITETGTVNAATNLDNILLRYDLDTVAPYDCTGESYSPSDTQYGSTDTDGFSSANGSSTFTPGGTVGISTTATLCVWPVLDVGSGAGIGETVELQISNPAVDVVGSGSANVGPTTTIAISGTTNLQKVDLRQMHYHFRNDTGDESDSGATSATGGSEDTNLSALPLLDPIRIRFGISNEGNKTSNSTSFRIEYAQKVSTCAAATGWTDVGGAGGDWDMYASTHITDGADTTNVLVANGGVTNENTTFLTPNGGVRDTSSQTGGLTLTSSNYVDLEYSVVSTANAVEGNTYCFRVTNAGTEITTYDRYPEATIQSDISVTATSTQRTTVDIPTTDVYVGGGFVMQDATAGSHTISSIMIVASGTVDYQNDLDNIELWYDLDTVAPYTCQGETYNGGETQFGLTDTNGFSATGTSLFSGSITINPTQSVCLYVVYDVLASTTDGETLDIQINNPKNDVIISSGTLSPNSLLSIPGVTRFVDYQTVLQHYHWRNDEGGESTTTSATAGVEDAIVTNVTQLGTERLRILVSNEGGTTTPNYQYRLEWGQRESSCSAVSTWTNVDTAGDAFQMYNSQYIVDGNNTTNISNSIGGVTDPAGSVFVTPNGGIKETSSQTGNIKIAQDEFVELEYSIQATLLATEGATYCFRVTNAGTPLDTYTVYPELTMKLANDFFIQRNVVNLSGTTVTITAGVDYIAPTSSTTAFIRITNAHYTGGGPSAGTSGNSNSSDVTAHIVNPGNITNSITFARAGATSDTRIAWEIIEYTGDPGGLNEIVVRQQASTTFGINELTATTSAVSGVQSDSDIVVFITGQGNPNTGRLDFNTGIATAAWNTAADTASFTRGEANGNATVISYAVVEFVGSNWSVQRIQHVYSSAGSTEFENISPVGSLSRAFVHAQHRAGSGMDTHADFGHEVWLSSIGQASFRINGSAGTAASHASVAWVIENIQTQGETMKVWRSNGTLNPGGGGGGITTQNIDIGGTLADVSASSIFISSSNSGTARSFPEPLITARLLNSSTTQYELQVSDDADPNLYRTAVIEWPTALRQITQNNYYLYVNNDALTPTDAWPSGAGDIGENAEITGSDDPVVSGESIRIRMTLAISASALVQGVDSFKLQFAPRSTTCSAIPSSSWQNLGDIGSTTALWRGVNTSVADGTTLTTRLVSTADTSGTFEEQNNTSLVPNTTLPGEDIEYDWAIEHNGAADKTSYCFRMVESGGTEFQSYNRYPTIRTAGFGVRSEQWRWYGDAENETPSTALSATNTAPIDIDFNDPIQLRVLLREVNGASYSTVKFRLQFSEYADFSTSTYVAGIDACVDGVSLWCYADGGGVDNATITTKLLPDAPSCTGSTGVGCGAHNESGTSTSQYKHEALEASEYAFTIRSAGARVNRVYYFRVYDYAQNETVPLSATSSYPSVVTKGGSLSFSMSSVNAGVTTEGVVTDATTTPTQINFGTLSFGAEKEAAHRLTVDANATEGYRVFMFSPSGFVNGYGDRIDGFTGTNNSPAAWNTGCATSETGCFAYHVGDDALFGGSTRFSPNDTYARLSSTTPEEVLYSSRPTVGEFSDVVYKVKITSLQEAGQYNATIMYIAVPVF